MDPSDIPTAMTITALSAVLGLHLAPLGTRALRRVPALATAFRRRRP
jgi:hypothetical protein